MKSATRLSIATLGAAALAGAVALPTHAADWSDTSIGWRYGTKFAEPYTADGITKNIFDLQHVSGYKYGTNFFNVDMLLSNHKDPAGLNTTDGAQETYVVYRNTLDIEKLSGLKLGFGPVRGGGVTFGFDYNSKTDAGYNSKKRMLVLGPTVMLDVPGFLDVSVLWLNESNAPCSDFSGTCVNRYTYKPHAMLTAAWGIPINLGPVHLSYEGFFNYIATKGKNEFGGPTSPETNWDSELMYDVGGALGGAPKTFKAGFEYQYWKNKFGNPSDSPGIQGGAFAHTPMVRLEYHF